MNDRGVGRAVVDGVGRAGNPAEQLDARCCRRRRARASTRPRSDSTRKVSEGVAVDDGMPFVDAHLEERLRRVRAADRVDAHVETAEPLGRLAHHQVHDVGVEDVGDEGLRGPAHLADGFSGVGAVGDVDQCEVAPGPGELDRAAPTDAASGSFSAIRPSSPSRPAR